MKVSLTFQNNHTAADLLIGRRFKREVPGLVEKTLDQNYGLAELGVFPPAATKMLVDVPDPADAKKTIVIHLYD